MGSFHQNFWLPRISRTQINPCVQAQLYCLFTLCWVFFLHCKIKCAYKSFDGFLLAVLCIFRAILHVNFDIQSMTLKFLLLKDSTTLQECMQKRKRRSTSLMGTNYSNNSVHRSLRQRSKCQRLFCFHFCSVWGHPKSIENTRQSRFCSLSPLCECSTWIQVFATVVLYIVAALIPHQDTARGG